MRIPGPYGLPFLGVLPWLVRDPLSCLTQAIRQHGDIVRLPIGPSAIYVLNHPDAIKHVLQDNHRNYHKGSSARAVEELLGDGLATSDGELWREQRKIVQPVFHRQHVMALCAAMPAQIGALLQSWEGPAQQGATLEIGAEMLRIAQAIMLQTMFGTRPDQGADEIATSLEIVLTHLSNRVWANFLPAALLPGRRQFTRALETLNATVRRLIAERRASGGQDDLLGLLVHARDSDTGMALSDKLLRDEVMTFFVAGQETLATSLSWIWHLLGRHPDVAGRLRDEVDAVLGGQPPTLDALPRMPYLRMVQDEALRLYPPAWVMFRSPLADDEVRGYHLPVGAVVTISPYLIQRHPALWSDPDRFDPERFTPERAAGYSRYVYMPFGAGPRLCVGRHLALLEGQLILTQILQRYELRPLPGREVKPLARLSLRPRNGVWMSVHRRS